MMCRGNGYHGLCVDRCKGKMVFVGMCKGLCEIMNYDVHGYHGLCVDRCKGKMVFVGMCEGSMGLCVSMGWPEPYIRTYIRCIYGIFSRKMTIRMYIRPNTAYIYGSGQP
jgi:hypothetical protein